MSFIASAYTQAHSSAQAAAGAQHYPEASLYVVATPIGNLADISLRALYVLGLVDSIACEDTRHTGQLLHAYGLHPPAHALLAVHEHNERQAAQTVIAKLQGGARVAYVSDAGTPGVSDPGGRLVTAVAQAGFRVIPLPGASSVTTALSVAGCVQTNGFLFIGFLPTKKTERQTALANLRETPRAIVLLEAPHRIEMLFQELAAWGARQVTIGRELTKQFETILTLPAADLSTWLAAKAQHGRGEFVLVIHPLDAPDSTAGQPLDSQVSTTARALLARLLQELPLKTAVQITLEITHLPKNAIYDLALALKQTAKGDDPP